MTNELLLKQIKTAMQDMHPEALDHFLKLMPDFLQCFTDEEVSATLIIKAVHQEVGDVHSINADELEMNEMVFELCQLLGFIDFQAATAPVCLH
jgi:hypothetical protein